MSIQARKNLINSRHVVFQRDSQESDLLDVNLTHSELIGALLYIINAGHYIEVTAVRSDHHDDSGLSADGVGTHARGWAIDCWPLDSATAGDYTDASDESFGDFLEDCAKAPFLRQIGLAGSADTPANRSAAGKTVFCDSGADHVHLGFEA